MKGIIWRIASLMHQSASQYPGGLKAVFDAMKDAGDSRADKTFYQDMSDKARRAADGRMLPPCPKVSDLVGCAEITGDLNAIRALVGHFGYGLASQGDNEPDAPTMFEEFSQDHKRLVEFHEAGKQYRAGQIDVIQLIAARDAAIDDIKESLSRTLAGDVVPPGFKVVEVMRQ